MAAALAFWAAALLIGALALPLAFALLRRLPDSGAGMAFALGLAFLGYGYFLLRWLSVLPPGRGGYLLAVAGLALTAAAVAGRDRRLPATLRRSGPAIAAAAGLFTFFFFAYVGFRAYQPDITGTEQPMDFMYLNATLGSPGYPPQDSWLAGERASYYYFGYLQVGALTEVAGVRASEGYNLGLAYTFAAAATGIASLVFALARWTLGSRGQRWAVVAAGTAVVLLLAVGSLSAVFEWAAAHGHYNASLYRAFGVEWLIPCHGGPTQDCFSGLLSPRTTSWYPTEFWFWWRGSRIIPGTITEFPFFSFLLGDLHPHVMSIPLVFLSLGLSASLWRGREALNLWSHRRPATGIALALVFGALAFQNAWDILTFSAVLAVAVVARNARDRPFAQALRAAASYLGPVFAVAVIAYLPWYVDFRSQASGIYPYVGEGTRPEHAFLQFGPVVLASLLGLSWSFRGHGRASFSQALVATAWLPLLPLAGWVLLTAYHGQTRLGIEARGPGGWVTLIVYATSAWAMAAAFLQLSRLRRPEAFALGLGATGMLLLYGAELFLIRDVFFGQSPRLNTVFKLSYQAWMLLSASGAMGLALALRGLWRSRARSGLLALPVGLLVVGGLVYPLTALPNRTEGFQKDVPATIDGLAFLARNSPGEYALTRWVEEHTAPGEVMIEASGRAWRRDEHGQPVIFDAGVDYTDAGRIAARTGRTTPIGWYFHEIQWRGDSPANQREFTRRQDLVDRAYTSKDPADVLAVMREAGARYLVVGDVELSRFPGDLMPKFEQFLDVAFESSGRRVYSVPSYEVVPTS